MPDPRITETLPRQSRRWTPAPAVRLSIWLHAALVPALAVWPAEWPWIIAALLGDHLVLACFGMLPRSGALGPNVVRLTVPPEVTGFVVLTFDDGPDPEVTPRVLDLLDQHNAKASFFCVGKRAARHPDIVREVVRRGHSVENHSDRHPAAFPAYPPWALRHEIDRAQIILTALSGRAPRFFRAPAGLRSPLLAPVLAHAGLDYASWSRRGFDTATRDAGKVLRRLMCDLRAGDIILLHDTARSRAQGGTPIVLEVLPELLRRIGNEGFRALSLPMGVAQSGPAA